MWAISGQSLSTLPLGMLAYWHYRWLLFPFELVCSTFHVAYLHWQAAATLTYELYTFQSACSSYNSVLCVQCICRLNRWQLGSRSSFNTILEHTHVSFGHISLEIWFVHCPFSSSANQNSRFWTRLNKWHFSYWDGSSFIDYYWASRRPLAKFLFS